MSTGRFARDRVAPAQVLLDAVWHRRPRVSVRDAELMQAVLLAQRNRVSARLARIYPARLRHLVLQGEACERAFASALHRASRRLAAADVPHTLIRTDPLPDGACGAVDLLVSPDVWEDAIDLLRPLAVRIAAPSHDRDSLLIHPASGPAVRLRRSVSWCDVRLLSAEQIERDAAPAPRGAWLVPDPADALLLGLAQILQTHEITLGEALVLRPMLGRPVADEAAGRAASAGWGTGFWRVLTAASALTAQFDAGPPPALPCRLPIGTRYLVGAEHAAAAWRSRARATAVREVTLLPALAGVRRSRFER